MSSLIFNNVSSSPAAVGSGKSQLYMKTDGKTYMQSESNAEQLVDRGKILQVIEDSDTTEVAITSTSWVDSGLEITITPTSASSKVLLQAHLQNRLPQNSGQSYRFTRDGTSLFTPGVGHGAYNGNASNDYQYPSISQLDAPATTSAIVYKVQIRGYTSTVSDFNFDGEFRVSLLAMEIAG